MNKPTIALITVAALGLGTLIGLSLTEEKAEPSQAVSEAGQAAAIDTPHSRGGAPFFRYFGPGDISTVYDEFGRVEPSVLGENFVAQAGPLKAETLKIRLEPDADTEYKALMDQGNAMIYSWTTDAGQVYFDFHAHDEAFGEEFFTRYAEGEGSAHAGMIVAPYGGEHGWYLLNLENAVVTVTLNVSGYYDKIIEIVPASE